MQITGCRILNVSRFCRQGVRCYLTLTCICKRQIAPYLVSRGKIEEKGARGNGCRKGVHSLREGIYTYLPYYQAEVLFGQVQDPV